MGYITGVDKHYDLCVATAKKFNKQVTLCEYRSYASGEHPDVLVYDYKGTTLFEIKTSRSDFFIDAKKDCRKKYSSFDNTKELKHLGKWRYFVCESGLIRPEELPDGWGLYWYSNGKFYIKKKSQKFNACNENAEKNLLMHALRKYANGNGEGTIFVKEY